MLHSPHRQSRQRLARERDWWRPLRYLLRLPLLAWHLLVDLPLTLLLASAPGRMLRLPGGERLDRFAIRCWQGGLLRVFGFRLRCIGRPNRQPTLFVANHCSWLDISLIHSQRALAFVAKSEIARWPLVGRIARLADTIYHRRGDTESLAEVSAAVVACLRSGHSAGVFQEGGALGRVDRVRTFHARMFQVCYDADVPAQPVALRYLRDGEPAETVAFRVGESFVANLWRLLGDKGSLAEVHFLAPVALDPAGRRRMAEAARQQIASVLERPSPADRDHVGERKSEVDHVA